MLHELGHAFMAHIPACRDDVPLNEPTYQLMLIFMHSERQGVAGMPQARVLSDAVPVKTLFMHAEVPDTLSMRHALAYIYIYIYIKLACML
jgi:hypothetical protein